MSLHTFFGCFFLAYSPVLAIFFLHIASNAQYVLLMVSSAFFCLVSLLLSSTIWCFSKDLPISNQNVSIAYSVGTQEVCRLLFLIGFSRVESRFNTVSGNPQSPFNRPTFAFVSGYGFSLMCSLVSYISLLEESIGPGVIMCISYPQVSVYFMSAITTSMFSLLHILWMVIAFEGYMDRASVTGWLKISWVVLSHYGASYGTTLISSTIHYGCIYATVISLALFMVSLVITIHSLKKQSYQAYKT